MRKVLVLLIIVNSALFAEKQEIGRFIWEFRSFPKENVLEIHFSTNVPDELLIGDPETGKTMTEAYKKGMEGAYGVPSLKVTGIPNDFIVRITYDPNLWYQLDTYPETFLMIFLGYIENRTNMKTADLLLEGFLAAIRHNNTSGEVSIHQAWSLNDEEYYWRSEIRGYHSLIATYVVYREE